MDNKLTIEQVIAFLLSGLDSCLKNAVVLKLDSAVALDTDQMMVMVRRRLINFVVFVAFSQL